MSNGEPEVRQIQLAPIEVSLNGCTFDVVERPDGVKLLRFIHQSGVIAYIAPLTKEAAGNLARQLTGITIARDLPVMAVPKSRAH
jgi:hypothetical protein